MPAVPRSAARVANMKAGGFVPRSALAVFAIVLVCGLARAPVRAQEPATRIIDHFIIDRTLLAKTGQRHSSVDFESKPELGPVWVILNYTAKVTGPGGDGRTAFGVFPEAVAVPIGEAFMLFQARFMANYQVDDTLTLYFAGKSRVLTRSEMREVMTAEQFAQYTAAINEEKKRTSDWVQLVQTNRYQIPATEPGKIHVEMNTLEGMQPMNLEVLVGQGLVPAGFKTYMERRNRSWFHRYQHFIYLVGVALALWFLAARYLWKRE